MSTNRRLAAAALVGAALCAFALLTDDGGDA